MAVKCVRHSCFDAVTTYSTTTGNISMPLQWKISFAKLRKINLVKNCVDWQECTVEILSSCCKSHVATVLNQIIKSQTQCCYFNEFHFLYIITHISVLYWNKFKFRLEVHGRKKCEINWMLQQHHIHFNSIYYYYYHFIWRKTHISSI